MVYKGPDDTNSIPVIGFEYVRLMAEQIMKHARDSEKEASILSVGLGALPAYLDACVRKVLANDYKFSLQPFLLANRLALTMQSFWLQDALGQVSCVEIDETVIKVSFKS